MSGLTTKQGLERVKELYGDRSRRAIELKEQGKKVVGYFCIYPPVELLTAADVVPFRMMGKPEEPRSECDLYLESRQCGFVRSCFEIALKGGYDFLDGLIFPHSCEHIERLYSLWTYYLKYDYVTHFTNVPHTLYPSSHTFFRTELDRLKRSLEELTGKEITTERLKSSIELHNQIRALLREINGLRKSNPPMVTGSEMAEIIVATSVIPASEQLELLQEVLGELRLRPVGPERTSARVLIYGSHIDSNKVARLIEDCGVDVVADDSCLGTRDYSFEVNLENGDCLSALAYTYLEKTMCPRTFRGSFQNSSDAYFKHIVDYAREFNAQGVIVYYMNFCDCAGYDIPALRDYLQKEGYPLLYMEDDYTLSAPGQLKTRIQAFEEMIGN
ncbi:MAG: 2-hydroxyacyl-CoA dehydratase subunit D [Bacillota bacterium]